MAHRKTHSRLSVATIGLICTLIGASIGIVSAAVCIGTERGVVLTKIETLVGKVDGISLDVKAIVGDVSSLSTDMARLKAIHEK
jgi:hypothetical protein